MKATTLIAAIIACTFCAASADARSTTPRKPPVDEFKKLDTNHDGVLSLEEFLAGGKGYTKEEFDKLDKNHDGKLDRYEFSQMHKKHSEGGGVKPAPATDPLGPSTPTAPAAQ